MALPLSSARGGFRRRIQLSHFIRDTLMAGDTEPHDIYIAYKTEVQKEPSPDFVRVASRRIRSSIIKVRRTRKGERIKVSAAEINAHLQDYISGGTYDVGGTTVTWGPHNLRNKRRCINYNGFMHYVYVLKRLGLVESTGQTAIARGKSGSPETEWHEEHPSELIRAVSGGLSDPAWDNIWKAYPSA